MNDQREAGQAKTLSRPIVEATEGQVNKEIDTLYHECDIVSDLINQLEGRLRDVLTEPQPNETKEGQGCVLVPIAHRISIASGNVKSYRATISDILDRLEL